MINNQTEADSMISSTPELVNVRRRESTSNNGSAAAAAAEEMNRSSAIINFYQNRSVLITGGSGFIGKVLIEKLLRTCPGIRRIYVLIRPKWNKKPSERLEELLGSPLYDGIRERGVNVEQRVILVEGDVTEPQLGLSEQNLLRVMNEVSVIYHSAATVKFDEPLKQSIGINIAGVKNMIEVCRKIPQLAALVHVSTAYANCDQQQEIDEHIYPVDKLDPEKLIELANWLDQDTLQELKHKLLGARPNTYTYTKALAEWLLVKSARDLPVVICRPSIVVASHREPFCGWIDNCNGPTGIVLGTGKGLVRTMLAQKSYVADLVPVDAVINLIISLGWFAHIYRNHKSNHELTESQTESLLGSESGSADAESLDGSDDVVIMNSNKQGLTVTTTTATRDNRNLNGNNNNNSSPHFVHHNHNHNHHLHPHHTTSESNNSNCISNLDDGYGTHSPDIRSPSTSSSSSCSLKHVKITTTSSPSSPFDSLKQTKTTAATATATDTRHTTPTDDEEEDCDCNYNNLIENEKFQSFVAERRLAEQKHAAFEYKLKQFRHNIQLKLSAKGLPEELADVPVFHCTSGAENPITWGHIQVLTVSALIRYPSSSVFRYPSGAFTSSKHLDSFFHWTLHIAPAYAVDFIAKLVGKKPLFVKIFRKYEQAAHVLQAFTMKEWRFNPDNRLMLYNELLSQEDRKLFNCDMMDIDWAQFFDEYIRGVRKYILKESDDTLEQSRRSLNLIYYRNTSLQILFMAMVAYFFLA